MYHTSEYTFVENENGKSCSPRAKKTYCVYYTQYIYDLEMYTIASDRFRLCVICYNMTYSVRVSVQDRAQPRARAPIDNPVSVRLSSNYNHRVLWLYVYSKSFTTVIIRYKHIEYSSELYADKILFFMTCTELSTRIDLTHARRTSVNKYQPH